MLSSFCPVGKFVKKERGIMAALKKHGRIQAIMTQFSYEHRRLDGHLTKIRKNADELAKMLDSLDRKNADKKRK